MLEENKLEAKTISQCKALRYKLKQIITSHSNAGGWSERDTQGGRGGREVQTVRAGQVSQELLVWGEKSACTCT